MHRHFGLTRTNFVATFLHTRSFNILRRSGRGVKRNSSENQRFSEEFIGLIDPLVTPERLWEFMLCNDNQSVGITFLTAYILGTRQNFIVLRHFSSDSAKLVIFTDVHEF